MTVQKVLQCFLLLVAVIEVSASLDSSPKAASFEHKGKTIADKLLVTEYIKAGKIAEARELSLVTGLEPNITSYAGYITVNEECDSNLFYWFFPSQNDMENDPLTVWLHGGPGAAGVAGVLTEHGHYALNMDGKLEIREYSWNRNSSVLYFDSPVGTGFSYTSREECYATEETQVSRELLIALQQFYLLFPELEGNAFYITGESYGGKFVPGLATTIRNSEDAKNINLKGIAIGDGWIDPINQMNLSAYCYQVGIVDRNRRDLMAREEETTRMLIEEGLYTDAYHQRDFLLVGLLMPASGFYLFHNLLYNYGVPLPDVAEFANRPEVQEALHVGNKTFEVVNIKVAEKFYGSFMQSRKSWMQESMENYRVIHYSGQLDIIVPYETTLSFLQKMEWSGSEEYRTAQRSNWFVDGELAGYSKTVKNFTEILVRNAGHQVPINQPKWAFDIHQKLLFNEPF